MDALPQHGSEGEGGHRGRAVDGGSAWLHGRLLPVLRLPAALRRDGGGGGRARC